MWPVTFVKYLKRWKILLFIFKVFTLFKINNLPSYIWSRWAKANGRELVVWPCVATFHRYTCSTVKRKTKWWMCKLSASKWWYQVVVVGQGAGRGERANFLQPGYNGKCTSVCLLWAQPPGRVDMVQLFLVKKVLCVRVCLTITNAYTRLNPHTGSQPAIQTQSDAKRDGQEQDNS